MYSSVQLAYLISALFFLTSFVYIYVFAMTIVTNRQSRINREYLVSIAYVTIACISYGFMTIAAPGVSMRVLWAIGFTAYLMLLTTWVRFSSNMVTIKHQFSRFLLRRGLIFFSLVMAFAVIISDRVRFIPTLFGNQFSYDGSPVFIALFVFVCALGLIILSIHIKWWREAEMKRQRIQQFWYLFLLIPLAPIGFMTDFIVPSWTNYTIAPLASITLFPASLHLFISMNVNKTLNITVPNVSAYVFKSVTIPTLVLDHKNTICLENDAAFEFLGKKLLGKNISDIILINEKTPEPFFFDRDVENRNVLAQTVHGTRLCNLLLTVQHDKYNEALCKVLLLRDITDEEEMLRKMRETSEKLTVALEEANAASRAKSDFLSNMSHEMRTPMSAILGMTTIARRTENLEEKDRALVKIEDASSHLLNVINDVLDMAKIEANKLELVPVEYDFHNMLHKVLSVVGYRIAEKQQTLDVQIADNIPRHLIGDDHRLMQVITNLMTNAIKFTPEFGRIALKVSFDCESDSVCALHVEISDSGIGISAEQQKKIFLPFEQAETGTSREYGGTGLGLVITKRIIDLMDGSIWVESALGAGAHFFFTVKALRGSREDLLSDSESYEDLSIDFSCVDGEFSGKAVLVAEDIEINREIIITLLEGTGLTIDCAENGQEALEIIAASPNKYDLVFMDMQMPQMDGLEATKRIRALPFPGIKQLPIIAMTANVFKDDIEACLDAGMNGHLGKPLNLDRVIETLRQYL